MRCFFFRVGSKSSSHIMIYHVKSEDIVLRMCGKQVSPSPTPMGINVLKFSLDNFDECLCFFSAHGIHVNELLSQCHEHSLLSQDCLFLWKSLMYRIFFFMWYSICFCKRTHFSERMCVKVFNVLLHESPVSCKTWRLSKMPLTFAYIQAYQKVPMWSNFQILWFVCAQLCMLYLRNTRTFFYYLYKTCFSLSKRLYQIDLTFVYQDFCMSLQRFITLIMQGFPLAMAWMAPRNSREHEQQKGKIIEGASSKKLET